MTIHRAPTPLLVLGFLWATAQAQSSTISEPLLLVVHSRGDELVEQLSELPAQTLGPLSDGTIPPIEQRRLVLYEQLRGLGDDALPPLARALRNPDVRLRRTAAFVLVMMGSGSYGVTQPKLNIGVALPALIAALEDADIRVRAFSAQANQHHWF